jgi:hypothetical protein
MALGMGVPLADEVDGACAFPPFPRGDFLMSLVLPHESKARSTIPWHGRRAFQYLDVRTAMVAQEDAAGLVAGFRRGREAGGVPHDAFGQGPPPQAGQRAIRFGFPSLTPTALRWSIVTDLQR